MAYDRAKDIYTGAGPSLDQPATKVMVITPSDDTDVDIYPKNLVVVVPTGTEDPTISFLPMKEDNDENTVDIALPIGTSIFPFRVRRVMDTGTSAGITILGGYD